MLRVLRFLWRLPRNVAIFFVRVYQRYFSPDHSAWGKAMFPHGYCKYEPSCSQYAVEVLEKDGFIWGSLRAIWRVLRCNPCSHGGVDEA